MKIPQDLPDKKVGDYTYYEFCNSEIYKKALEKLENLFTKAGEEQQKLQEEHNSLSDEDYQKFYSAINESPIFSKFSGFIDQKQEELVKNLEEKLKFSDKNDLQFASSYFDNILIAPQTPNFTKFGVNV